MSGAGLRISAFICGFVCLSSAAAIHVIDDAGRKVELEQPARRIVSLAPFLTELVYSAQAGDRLVGVSEHSDYPPAARKLPTVSSATHLSIEPLLALKPDLALAWRDSIRSDDVERLERFGVRVFVAQARRLDDAPRLLEAIGRLAGTRMERQAQAFRDAIERQRARHAGKRRIPVLLEVWHRPLTTIAGRHWMNEALEVCGARNAFEDLPGVAPQVSWEEVYARDPEAIVGAGSLGGRRQFVSQWRERGTLSAVKAGRLVFVEADTLQRPTLRLSLGVEQLCAGIDAVRAGSPLG